MTRYFEFTYGDEAGWHIEHEKAFPDGSPVDLWSYAGGHRVESTRIVPLRIQVDGKRVDYYCTIYLATVVSKRLADLWESIAPQDIQRIPATVEGDSGEWEVVVILPWIDCVDHQRSLIQYYPPDHPEKANKPRSVIQLALDTDRIGNHHIFHPADWQVATIASETIVNAMEKMGATGTEYRPVTEQRFYQIANGPRRPRGGD